MKWKRVSKAFLRFINGTNSVNVVFIQKEWPVRICHQIFNFSNISWVILKYFKRLFKETWKFLRVCKKNFFNKTDKTVTKNTIGNWIFFITQTRYFRQYMKDSENIYLIENKKPRYLVITFVKYPFYFYFLVSSKIRNDGKKFQK